MLTCTLVTRERRNPSVGYVSIDLFHTRRFDVPDIPHPVGVSLATSAIYQIGLLVNASQW